MSKLWGTADFETNNNIDDCRVWLWGLYTSENLFFHGETIDSFIYECIRAKEMTVYFHNLKFDGEFIISYLLNNGYTHITERRDIASKTFETLITDKGVFYAMTIYFEAKGKRRIKVKIIDSLKVIPLSVDQMARSFGMEISKLSIDYNADRGTDYKATEEEIHYLKNDCMIPFKALEFFFSMGLNKMTIASNALYDYKKETGKYFDKWFPSIDSYDKDIRPAYKGGYTYLKEEYKEKVVDSGIVLDVNSLYPWVLRDCKLPYGMGVYFSGEYTADVDRPLYIQCLRCEFTVKPGYIPTIQLKGNYRFAQNEYIKNSNGEQTIYLSNIDLQIFLEHYHVSNIEYIGGWKFRAASGMFDGYIDKWSALKIESDKDGNKGLRTLAKLMLNSLYGKFAINPNVQSKIPYLDDEGIVRYKLGIKEMRDTLYTPVALFVTAHARYKTITAAQSLYDRFIYADTDSLHLIGSEPPTNLEIDQQKLGAWKLETTFVKAKFIRQKSYIEEMTDGKLSVVCAGMPHKLHSQVASFDDFSTGKVYGGKLSPVRCKGGIVLKEIDFTIKP